MIEWLVDALPILMLVVLAGALLLGYPVAFVLAGVGTLFALVGAALDEFPLVAFYNVPLRVWGSVNASLVYPAVPMLLYMGIALERSGVARELLQCLQWLLRRVPGNLPIAMTLIGILLAPIAGLVGASVATLALIGLPTMLAQGYRPSVATGSVAAAGTLGIILPPGVMLFLLAEHFRVQMAAMFVAPVVPVLILAGLFVAYYVATGDRHLMRRQSEQLDSIGAVALLRGLVLPVGLVGLVLASILAGWATPTQSAAVGALGATIILGLKGRFDYRNFQAVLIKTAMTNAMVFFIIVSATIFSYPFNYFGGPDLVADFLRGLGLADFGMLLVILFITFILGFFVDWIEVFVVALPIFQPVIEGLDFSAHAGSADLAELWIAVLFALVLQTSFLTPPFGFALFFVKGASPPSVRLVEIYRGVFPVVVLQLAVIGAVLAWPSVALELAKRVLAQ